MSQCLFCEAWGLTPGSECPACRRVAVEVVDVRALREHFALDTSEFAALVGVSVSTVYRWEGQTAPLVEPLQTALIAVVRELRARGEGPALGRVLRTTLATRGNLQALYRLLQAFFEKAPPSRVSGPRTARRAPRVGSTARKRPRGE